MRHQRNHPLHERQGMPNVCQIRKSNWENLLTCHNAQSQEKIHEMLQTGGSNAYTIEKNGIKKMIYQTAWFNEGIVGGLVEISMELPGEMPHYIRK